MNTLDKILILKHIIKWRLTWNRRNTHYRFTVDGNPKFIGPRDAAAMIKDGDVVANSGLGGNQRASILYWAIREIFEETGHPANLTFLTIGGHGGRGIVPGTLDEIGREGLCKRFITAHFETFKTVLKLAEEKKCELQCIPQGTFAMLIDAMGRGEKSLLTKTGVGTFVDPRVGPGSRIFDPNAEQFITPEGDSLRYRAPLIDVALFNLPAADKEGNIYARNTAMVGESREIALAARANGGKVIANVGLIVEKGWSDVFIPADKVDAVVYFPGAEQTGSIPHSRHWALFTPEPDMPIEEGVARLKFVNQTLKITPTRDAVDNALARLAAATFADNAYKGAFVNIGVGLPEEVSRLIFEGGLISDVTFLTESGVLGGLPAPGVFFGASCCPKQIMSSAEIFKLCYKKLDVTCLGVLQADNTGSVNVSRRGAGPMNYVGPGGFIDLTTSARMVIFVSAWMAHSKMEIRDGKIRIVKPGKPKFIEKVDEITFCGPEALKAGKKVLYITNVGAFRLTERGMELISVMPGIDITRDILDFSPMKIVLPESGDVPVVDRSIITGEGFRLKFKDAPGAKT